MPEEAEPQIWDGLIWRAWAALKYDRSYTAFGGETPIPYRVYSQYAADHGINGDDFRFFLIMMQALDDEWLAWRAEQREREEQQRKARE